MAPSKEAWSRASRGIKDRLLDPCLPPSSDGVQSPAAAAVVVGLTTNPDAKEIIVERVEQRSS